MRENRLKALWAADQAAVNGWLHIPSSFSAEVMAHAGFDSVTIDTQHGMADYGSALAMLQAISTTAAVPLARVTWNEPGQIMRLLDFGCMGLICPMIETRAQCEAFVGACRYPPVGYRSNGPTRATIYAGADYVVNANAHIVAFAMIETKLGLENIDDILSVPTLDAIYVGPADLQQSLHGVIKPDNTEPEFLALLSGIVEACKRHGIVPGIHAGSAAWARRMIDLGFRFVSIASDGRMLSAAAAAAVTAVKGAKVEDKVKY